MSKFLELNEKNDGVESKIGVRVIINKINDYFENNDNKAINNLNISGKGGIGKTTIAYNVKSKLNKDIKCKLFSLGEYEIDSNPYLKTEFYAYWLTLNS